MGRGGGDAGRGGGDKARFWLGVAEYDDSMGDPTVSILSANVKGTPEGGVLVSMDRLVNQDSGCSMLVGSTIGVKGGDEMRSARGIVGVVIVVELEQMKRWVLCERFLYLSSLLCSVVVRTDKGFFL